MTSKKKTAKKKTSKKKTSKKKTAKKEITAIDIDKYVKYFRDHNLISYKAFESEEPERLHVSENTIFHIKRITVINLFGRFRYDINLNALEKTNNINVLYGDNGCGKTTVLNLIYRILSSVKQRGDKSYVARTPFKSFKIYFNNSLTISVKRVNESLTGTYTYNIKYKNNIREYTLRASSDDAIREEDNVSETRNLHRDLEALKINIIFLPDDRKVKASYDFGLIHKATDLENGHALLRQGRYARSISSRPSSDELSHHLNILPLLDNIHEYVKNKSIKGSRVGDESANTIYLNLMKEVSSTAYSRKDQKIPSKRDIKIRFKTIEDTSREYAEFGLISPFNSGEFISLLDKQVNPQEERFLMRLALLRMDGLVARLDALKSVRDEISTFVSLVNSFLHYKYVYFSMQEGIQIVNKDGGVLNPNRLSSGEKQLILLLGHALISRDRATILLVDEPELSLNIKWQSKLIDALKACSGGVTPQYILATHCLEMLVKHKHSIVKLGH